MEMYGVWANGFFYIWALLCKVLIPMNNPLCIVLSVKNFHMRGYVWGWLLRCMIKTRQRISSTLQMRERAYVASPFLLMISNSRVSYSQCFSRTKFLSKKAAVTHWRGISDISLQCIRGRDVVSCLFCSEYNLCLLSLTNGRGEFSFFSLKYVLPSEYFEGLETLQIFCFHKGVGISNIFTFHKKFFNDHLYQHPRRLTFVTFYGRLLCKIYIF